MLTVRIWRAVALFIPCITGCSTGFAKDRGVIYLHGLSAGWEPVYEYATLGGNGQVTYHLRYSLGKGYFRTEATGRCPVRS
jgi:hypothetical protein